MERLTSGRALSDERRVQLDRVMRRETLALRQLVRQFVDYTRLKSERGLHLELQPVDLGALGATIAPTSVPHDLPRVLADPDRLHQMLTSFAGDAARDVQPPDQAQIAATHADGREMVTISGPAPPHDTPFDEAGGSAGIALYVSAELARLQGGTVGLTEKPGGGSCYTLVLSAA